MQVKDTHSLLVGKNRMKAAQSSDTTWKLHVSFVRHQTLKDFIWSEIRRKGSDMTRREQEKDEEMKRKGRKLWDQGKKSRH